MGVIRTLHAGYEDLIRNPDGRAAKRIARVGEDNICTSIIAAAELRYGCAKSDSKRLLKAVNVLPFDVPADAEYGGIRSKLEAAGKPIGSNDLLIAAHAYATGATIVTANANAFKRIRGNRLPSALGSCLVTGPASGYGCRRRTILGTRNASWRLK